MEIRYSLQIMPKGRHQEHQETMLQLLQRLLVEKIEGRIAPFDTAAAQEATNVITVRKVKGQPGDFRDTMIAGIALATRATLAARNASHFADLSVPVINPWAL